MDTQQINPTTLINQTQIIETTTTPEMENLNPITDVPIETPGAFELVAQENEFHINDMLEKRVNLDSFLWTTTINQNGPIFTHRFPHKILLEANQEHWPYRRILELFTYFRVTMMFSVQLTGNKFFQGSMFINWFPLDLYDQLATSIVRPVMSGFPHIKLDANDTRIVSLEIPHHYMNPVFRTREAFKEPLAFMGTLRGTCFNKLQTGSTSDTTSLRGNVYFQFINPEVHIPMQPYTSIPTPFDESKFADTEALVSKSKLKQPTIQKKKPSVINDSGEIKDTASFSKSITEGVSIIPQALTGNFSGAWTSFKDSFSNGANFIGKNFGKLLGLFFDRPAIEFDITPSKIVTTSTFTHSVGNDASIRLATTPNSCHLVQPHLVGGITDETDLHNIASIPMWIYTITWNDSLARGSILYSTAVNPLLCSRDVALADYFSPTYLAYVAKAATFWRGSITFHWEIISTTMHRGNLLAVFIPGLNPGEPQLLTPEAITNSPHKIFDISEANHGEFVCPYQMATEYLHVHGPVMTAGDSGRFVDRPGNDIDIDAFSGTFYLIVQNELANPSSVANNVEVNIYISAGPDFEIAVPYALDRRPAPSKPTFADTEGLITHQRSEKDITEPVVFGNFVEKRMDHHFVGEKYSDIKDFSSRFSKIAEWPVELSTTVNAQAVLPVCADIYVRETPAVPAVVTKSAVSWMGYFSRLFLFSAGSIRYKFLSAASKNTNALVRISHVLPPKFLGGPDLYNVAQMNFTAQQFQKAYGQTGMATDMWNLAHSAATEIEIPFYNINSAIRNPLGADIFSFETTYRVRSWNWTSSQVFCEILCSTPDSEGAKFNIDVLAAAGDDWRPFVLICPPLLSAADFTGADNYPLEVNSI